jgi:hypothetical protein
VDPRPVALPGLVEQFLDAGFLLREDVIKLQLRMKSLEGSGLPTKPR